MARKILYFIAGSTPTAGEAAQIANIVGDVQIRSNLFSAQYGERLEPADGLAGTIPAAYKTASGGTTVDTDVFPQGDVTPTGGENVAFNTFPPTANADVSDGAPGLQLRAIGGALNEATGAITLTDLTTVCVWSSSDETKATVGAATGIVTAVAAGACVITATYDPADGVARTDTTAVTVVA